MAKNKKASKLTKSEQKYVIRRLLGFAKRFIPLFIIAFIFAAASTVMSHYIPVLVGNGIDLSRDELIRRIRELHAADVKLPVIISGDRRSSLGAGVEILSLLEKSGIERTSFQVTGEK